MTQMLELVKKDLKMCTCYKYVQGLHEMKYRMNAWIEKLRREMGRIKIN